jgi:hypothetical protein
LRDNAEVDQSVLQFLVTAIAAGASLTAVLLGIDQLSSGARLRNLESILRAAAGTPDGRHRDEVVASLHRNTLARLIAREAVPFRSFLVPSVLIVVGAATAVRSGVRDVAPWWDALGGIAMSALVMALGVVQITNLTRERARIRSWYEEGLTPLRAFADLTAQMVGGSLRLTFTAVAEAISGSAFFYCFARVLLLRLHTTTGDVLTLVACLSLVAMAILATALIAMSATGLGQEPWIGGGVYRPSWVQPSPMPPFGVEAGHPDSDQPTA